MHSYLQIVNITHNRGDAVGIGNAVEGVRVGDNDSAIAGCLIGDDGEVLLRILRLPLQLQEEKSGSSARRRS